MGMDGRLVIYNKWVETRCRLRLKGSMIKSTQLLTIRRQKRSEKAIIA